MKKLLLIFIVCLLSISSYAARPYLGLYVQATNGIVVSPLSFVTNNTNFIMILPTDATPDGAADYVRIYDASTGLMKKALINDIAGGGSGEINTAANMTPQTQGVTGGLATTNVGTVIQLKTISGTNGITIHTNATNIVISNTVAAGSSVFNYASNNYDAGSDVGALAGTNANTLTFNVFDSEFFASNNNVIYVKDPAIVTNLNVDAVLNVSNITVSAEVVLSHLSDGAATIDGGRLSNHNGVSLAELGALSNITTLDIQADLDALAGYANSQVLSNILANGGADTNNFSDEFTTNGVIRQLHSNNVNQLIRDSVPFISYVFYDDFNRDDTTNGWLGANSQSGHPYTLDSPTLGADPTNNAYITNGYVIAPLHPSFPGIRSNVVFIKTELANAPSHVGMRYQQRAGNGTGGTNSFVGLGISQNANHASQSIIVQAESNVVNLWLTTNGIGGSTYQKLVGWSPSLHVTNLEHEVISVDFIGTNIMSLGWRGTNILVHHPWIDSAKGRYIYYTLGAPQTNDVNTDYAIDAIWAGVSKSRQISYGNDFTLSTNGIGSLRAELTEPQLSLSIQSISNKVEPATLDPTNSYVLLFDEASNVLNKLAVHKIPGQGGGGGGGGVPAAHTNLTLYAALSMPYLTNFDNLAGALTGTNRRYWAIANSDTNFDIQSLDSGEIELYITNAGNYDITFTGLDSSAWIMNGAAEPDAPTNAVSLYRFWKSGDGLTNAIISFAGSLGIKKNDGFVGSRGNINFIEGSGITLTITDDGGNNEIDVTISGGAGSGTPVEINGDSIGVNLNFTTNVASVPANGIGGHFITNITTTPTQAIVSVLFDTNDFYAQSSHVLQSASTNENTVYIDVNGDDSTALRGDPNRPFATITNAIEAVTNDSVMLISPGVYVTGMSSNGGPVLSLTHMRNVTIMGNGGIPSLIFTNDTYTNFGDAFGLTEVTNITFKYLSLISPPERHPFTSGSAHESAISFFGSNIHNINIHRVEFRNWAAHGITHADDFRGTATNINVTHNYFYNIGATNAAGTWDGAAYSASGSDVDFSHNIVVNSFRGFEIEHDHVGVAAVSRNIVANNNQFHGMWGEAILLIANKLNLRDVENFVASDNVIIGWKTNDNLNPALNFGIKVNDVDGFIIKGNYIKDLHNDSISLAPTAGDSIVNGVISGNFLGHTLVSGTGDGIELNTENAGITNVLIGNNTFHAITNNGLVGGGVGMSVVNNVFQDVGMNGTGHAIRLRALGSQMTTNWLINGNVFRDSGLDVDGPAAFAISTEANVGSTHLGQNWVFDDIPAFSDNSSTTINEIEDYTTAAVNGAEDFIAFLDATDGLMKKVLIDNLPGGGTPGGADTEIQYNSGGTFLGTNSFTFNDVTDTLLVSNISASVSVITDQGQFNSFLQIPITNNSLEILGAEGYVGIVTNHGAQSNALVFLANTATNWVVSTIVPPTVDNTIPKYDLATKTIFWEADAGAAGGDSITVEGSAVVDPDFIVDHQQTIPPNAVTITVTNNVNDIGWYLLVDGTQLTNTGAALSNVLKIADSAQLGGAPTISDFSNMAHDHSSTNSGGPAVVVIEAQAGTGTINAGEVVYISGFDVGQTIVEVDLADADLASTMPAIGVATTTFNTTETGYIMISGNLSGQDTDQWSDGDEIYVATTAGQLTNVAPQGATAQIQKIGIVSRDHPSAGELQIIGAGRANALPNITSADFWVGNANGVATAVTMGGNVLMDNAGVVTIQPDQVTLDMLVDSAAGDSVLGKSDGAGTFEEITTTTDGEVLRFEAGAVDFGQIDLANANAVTGVLPDANVAATIARDSELSITNAYLPTNGGTIKNLTVNSNIFYPDVFAQIQVDDGAANGSNVFFLDANFAEVTIRGTNNIVITNLVNGVANTVVYCGISISNASGGAISLHTPDAYKWYGNTNNPPTSLAAGEEGKFMFEIRGTTMGDVYGGYSVAQ